MLGVMISYARSGGTLLNKCLASLDNIVMLSEVNPLGGGWGEKQENSPTTIQAQAKEWYNIDLENNDFKNAIEELDIFCQQNGKKLIIRDWSFINFSKHRYNNNTPPNEFLTLKQIDKKDKIFAFVRNSIDVWISRGMPDINKFFTEYNAYVEELIRLNVRIFKYEDFVKSPKLELERICNFLGIEYKDVIPECLNYSKVNGDTQIISGSRGAKIKQIKPIPRKQIPTENIYKINKSQQVRAVNKLLGYPLSYHENYFSDSIIIPLKYYSKRFGLSKIKNFFLDKKESSNIPFGLSNENKRNEWLEKTLKSLPNGIKILDAGAGQLKYKPYCSHLNYISQDFGKYDGTGDNKGLQTTTWDNSKLDIVSDIIDIPEPDSSFDAIMCVEVFEHLPEPIKAIKEFNRLLKKGGVLIITAPFASLTHFAPYHFYSGFNKYFYEKHLSENGFEIAELTPNGNYFEYLAQEIQLRVPNKYTDYQPDKKEKQATYTFLKMLEKMSGSDKSSSELLTFGYQVKAIKK